MKIIITGAGGYLGGVLAPFLAARGDEVVMVARHRPEITAQIARFSVWDGETLGDWAREIDGADAVINLAGRSVNCRYNEENKREILESRLKTTRIVARAIAEVKKPPSVWLNASGAIYQDQRKRDLDENGALGEGFSVEVCKAWESAFFETDLDKTRRVALRIALIFGKTAPILQVFERLTKFGLGGPQGDGGQYVSWIHERDCLRAITFLLENSALSGPVNVCAPNPLPNREFMRELRRAFKVPIGLPAPAIAMKIGAVFLQTEAELALKSRRAVPKRLLDAGFHFDFPRWSDAARAIVSNSQ